MFFMRVSAAALLLSGCSVQPKQDVEALMFAYNVGLCSDYVGDVELASFTDQQRELRAQGLKDRKSFAMPVDLDFCRSTLSRQIVRLNQKLWEGYANGN